ncbi:MAG: DUF4350 domain-containing protein [Gemmatimonadaceae bacterium]
MTIPVKQPWWIRPRIVLPLVTGLAVLAALSAPAGVGPRGGDPRLTTTSTTPLGAGLLYELAKRLGWQPERRLTPELEADPRVVHALLDPAIAIRSTETHALLEHVRAGGAALLVLGGSTGTLLDSLDLRINSTRGRMQWVEPDSASCEGRELSRTRSLWLGLPPQMLTFSWIAPPPSDVVHLLESLGMTRRVRADSLAPTMIGFSLGEGRVVVAADPDVFRTGAMRDCGPGLAVAAVRALEFLRDGGAVPRDRIVFDEYHQAFGAHPGTISAVLRYLGNSPSGRLLAQLTFAGLVLLFALGPRAVPPREEGRLERRSPLEQVDALARAYTQVGATRTVAQRLVRGVRRRAARGVIGSGPGRDRTLDDTAWLSLIAAQHPALAVDVDLARRAMAESLTARELPSLGPALHRIESIPTRPT